MNTAPLAHLGGHLATGLRDVTTDPSALDSQGWWAIVRTFEGTLACARFDDVRPAPLPRAARWNGPARSAWRSSLDRAAYVAAVESVRERIAAGEVYQANVCRVLSAPLPDADAADVVGLARLLSAGNPAPYSGVVRLPAGGGRDALEVVSSSPELYLRREDDLVRSRPIKGTGRSLADITEKDRAENVMIVDLVRNDLGAVARTGSVEVPELCAVEQHPGLVHLVSTVEARLRPEVGWPELFDATFPPGSVTGTPKLRALQVLAELEPVERGPYCGAVGWVDADRGVGELAVAIRTFWLQGGELHLGTGAGITWGSDPELEWAETELKAENLLGVASGRWPEVEHVQHATTTSHQR